VRWAAALVAALGISLLSFASASALTPQTVTFTSTPPSSPSVGRGYEIAATSSSGLPVELSLVGACSPTPPSLEREASLAEMLGPQSVRPPERATSPITVYFSQVGRCEISARAQGNSEYEPTLGVFQDIVVPKNPSERLSFASSPPSNPAVEGSYVPVVRSSARVGVYFTARPGSVCELVYEPQSTRVEFVGAGTCAIGVRQDGIREAEPPEAQQSFNVSPPSPAASEKTEAKLEQALRSCAHVKSKRRHRSCQASARREYAAAKAPTTLSATLIVHIRVCGGPPGTRCSNREHAFLEVTRIGPEEEAISTAVTRDDTVRVAPGRYTIRVDRGRRSGIVVVKAGQELEVPILISVK
jgi:hypothetical protein